MQRFDIVDGVAVYEKDFARKQPDWTFDTVDSGRSPVDRFTDRRADDDVDAAVEAASSSPVASGAAP